MDFDRDRLRAAGWVAAALLVAVLVVRALASGGGEEPGAVRVDQPPAAAPSSSRAEVVVQVAGEVRRPGVYTVSPGARVHEAVERAGGLTRRADPAGVNLVAKVADGQQVIVPRRGATAAGAASAPGAASSPGAASGGPGAAGPKVSLGSATVEQLDAIDGIGPTLAQRIVEYRQENGGFSSIDELRQVDGIGEKRFESLREAVTP
jgi:competence protein ComEA